MLPLVTPRLVLRQPTEADLQVFHEIHNEPEVTRIIVGGIRPDGGLELAWRNLAMLIGHWQLRGFGAWVVEERATGAVIGRVGYWQSVTWPGIELGWMIRKSRTGQGFATEAAHRAIAWARAETTIDRIISLILPDNAPSIRIATKVGERHERDIEVGGRMHHLYALNLDRHPGGC